MKQNSCSIRNRVIVNQDNFKDVFTKENGSRVRIYCHLSINVISIQAVFGLLVKEMMMNDLSVE